MPHTGTPATPGWFALQELLGHKNVKNYDARCTQYGSLPGALIELGN